MRVSVLRQVHDMNGRLDPMLSLPPDNSRQATRARDILLQWGLSHGPGRVLYLSLRGLMVELCRQPNEAMAG